jgi:hypothetical protein
MQRGLILLNVTEVIGTSTALGRLVTSCLNKRILRGRRVATGGSSILYRAVLCTAGTLIERTITGLGPRVDRTREQRVNQAMIFALRRGYTVPSTVTSCPVRHRSGHKQIVRPGAASTVPISNSRQKPKWQQLNGGCRENRRYAA